MIRIGTRDSRLAVWQAALVQQKLAVHNISAELVFIKSEGDIDLQTPLYAMGVQGVFTRSLDAALISNKIDIAVHSMKDVPTRLPMGIVQAAVLERGPVSDMLVFKNKEAMAKYTTAQANLNPNLSEKFGQNIDSESFAIATSSIRRKSQWQHRFANTNFFNIRGNVITRIEKLAAEPWDAVIFAQAGLERINERPPLSIEIDWMLPAPAQGAIVVQCRESDVEIAQYCNFLNDSETALCVKIERDFLQTLLGGCATPISALGQISDDNVFFRGNVFSTDGSQKAEISKTVHISEAATLGTKAGQDLLLSGAKAIVDGFRN